MRVCVPTDFTDNVIVSLDVGGQIFKTGIRTLRKYPNSRLARLAKGITKSNTEPIFLDRDPESFSAMLRFCRSGKLFVPPSMDRNVLMHEAEYYGLADAMFRRVNPTAGRTNTSDEASPSKTLPPLEQPALLPPVVHSPSPQTKDMRANQSGVTDKIVRHTTVLEPEISYLCLQAVSFFALAKA